MNLELPLGKRTIKYRLFEMLPATLSYGSILLLVLLSFFSPLLASIYLLIVIITLLVKAAGIAYHTILGHNKLLKAQKVDWSQRLSDLSYPAKSLERLENLKDDKTKQFGFKYHLDNLRLMSQAVDSYPDPENILHAVIIATYNESYDVLEPTLRAVYDSSFDSKKIILTIAYEERGGEAIENTVSRLKQEFAKYFHSFHLVMHPKDLPDEIIGKGANITYAGEYLKKYLLQSGIDYSSVIVTTLDSDNRPYKSYFDYVAYEYVVHEDRKRLSYQPVSLFFNNIWDAPAPMRVVATGNSFWNIISSMRPHTLRNFASHSQPMDALVEMGFWSKRSIVEDGHQYWRSYFYFSGNYSVTPIYVPIYQDAVLSDTYFKTLKAQFIQLRRWAYGASDVPYVAVRLFSKNRNVPFFEGFARLVRLLDGHVTLASVSILTAIGGWIPLLLNSNAYRDPVAHQLPDIVSFIQRIALVGLIITVFMAFKMLPPRPERYKRRRTVFMALQWILMPITAIVYSSVSALYSQGRLFIGRYLDKFDVTDKSVKQK